MLGLLQWLCQVCVLQRLRPLLTLLLSLSLLGCNGCFALSCLHLLVSLPVCGLVSIRPTVVGALLQIGMFACRASTADIILHSAVQLLYTALYVPQVTGASLLPHYP